MWEGLSVGAASTRPRRNLDTRFCLAVAFAGFAVTYIALFRFTEATHAGISYTGALLGVAFLFSHINVTLPLAGARPQFTLQELSITLALIGGDPAAALPALLVIHAHWAWMSATSRHATYTRLISGMFTIILQAWTYHFLGVLGSPDLVTASTIADALPLLAVVTLLRCVIEHQEPSDTPAVSPTWRERLTFSVTLYGVRLLASLLGVAAYAGKGFGMSVLLQSAGPIILLAVALAMPVLYLGRYRGWAKMYQLTESWQFDEKRVKQALENLHTMAPDHGHVLLVEDPVSRVTYRAWVDAYRTGVKTDILHLSLDEAIRKNPTPEAGWKLFSRPGRSTATVIKHRVALTQVNPLIGFSLMARSPVAYRTGVSLMLESMLDTVAAVARKTSEKSTTPTALSIMMANVQDGFAVVDSDGIIRSWNKSMEAFTNVTAQEAVGTKMSTTLKSFGSAVGTAGQPMIFTKDTEGNTRFLYITTFKDVPLGNGSPATLHNFHDVSRLVASTETRNQFFAYVTHEFKGPISALTMQAEALEDRYGHEDPDVADLSQTVDHLTELLADLSTSTELGVSQSPLKMSAKVINAHELLKFPWMCNTVTQFKHLQIKDSQDFTVYVDVFRARQIITNLVSNAVKYSPDNTPISLVYGADYETGFGYIQVIDQGIGVPDESKDALFEAYVRGRNATRTSGQGLGLPLSKTLAEQMGGTVTYKANCPKGSVFTLWIPLRDGSEPEDELTRKANAIA